MSRSKLVQASATKPTHNNANIFVVQRKCLCGGSRSLTGSCSECEKKKLIGEPLQTNLRISEPSNEYEQEADRVAEQVMRGAEVSVIAMDEYRPNSPSIKRKAAGNCQDLSEIPSIVHEVLASPGESLDGPTRESIEPYFSCNFSNVRVHKDDKAAKSAHAVNALAYTVGSDVVFAGARYAPQTKAGRRLLTHELTHVVQQQSGTDPILARAPEPQSGALVEKRVAPRSYATIEKLQRDGSEAFGDILGVLKIDGVPASELVAVKSAIASYFDQGTRNSEVDAVIAVPGSNRRIFYTLRFGPDNNVDVERIGAEGDSPLLDPFKLDIARAYGYTAAATDPYRLKSWLGTRYPSIRAEGETVEAIRESANKTLRAEVGRPEWFKKNYRIHILGPMAAKVRLLATRMFTLRQLASIKTYEENELRNIELSLELLSTEILKLFRGVRMVRQTIHPDDAERAEHANVESDEDLPEWAKQKPNEMPVVAGETKQFPNQTIILFDQAFQGKPLFAGGSRGVSSTASRTVLHEFGHVLQDKGFANSVFLNLARGRVFTDYAKQDWEGLEEFPEAFSIYVTDPEWVEDNYPDIFAWFEKLSRSGKVPELI